MLGTVDHQTELLDADQLCGHLIPEDSIHRKLAVLGDKLFSDRDFADLYDRARGRHSVPPSLVAKVMLLQSLEGTSDRETVDRVRRDIGWKVALGLSLQDDGFHPTVLTYFRERLRKSDEPRRIFDRFKQVATEAGLLTTRGVRVLDSTPVLSAVQTQDTVSLIKGALRRLLTLLARTNAATKAAIESALSRDDYAHRGKPAIDWDDEASRSMLVDELVRDALAALGALEGKEVSGEVADAAELLATVAGQDVYQDDDGNFRIRKGVAKDRVISVVDPDARHGHKSKSRHFDGYQAHVAVDPETELVTEIEVAPASTHEAELSRDLLPELNEDHAEVTVVADSAYGSGANLKTLQDAGASTVIKTQRDKNSWGGFPKSAFQIDLDARIATCPAGVTTNNYISHKDGGGAFRFPTEACASCALRSQCTSALSRGRSITFGPHEQLLSETRVFQQTKEFKAIYNTKRPTVERVIYRMVRNGGRKARYRGRVKVGEQIRLKAAAENIVRMLRLGLVWTADTRWALA
ncbi:MAG: IS1182 family transposase [Actinobacteria bacterium]|nr:IS1182 family transposase [Actinomycetota bacterium]